MTESKYPQVMRLVAETPWAILPGAFGPIVELVTHRAAGEAFTDEEIAARIGNRPAPFDGTVGESDGTVNIAVLNLYGVLVPKADLLSEISGASSLERFQSRFKAALADASADAILVNVDSPGGSVSLVPETAALIRAARGEKPIVAIANTMAASGAYQIASQADELVVTPSGIVGSIGVIAAHTDITARQEMDGIKTTLVAATDSPHKAELSPFKPLSDEARAALQERIDEAMGVFVRDVATGRGVTESKVRADFGQGRVVTPEDALAVGMVDRIATFDETVNGMIASIARSKQAQSGLRASKPTTFADEAQYAIDCVEAVVGRAQSIVKRAKGRPQPLSAANCERLAALRTSLGDASVALGVLLDDGTKAAARREIARFERLRSISH